MSIDSKILLKASEIFERPMNEIQVIGALQEVRDNEIKSAKYNRVVAILNQICKGVCYVGYKPTTDTYNYPARLAEYELKVKRNKEERLEHHPAFDGKRSGFSISSWDICHDGSIDVCLEWTDYEDGGTSERWLKLPKTWVDLKYPNFMDTVKEDVIKARQADDDAKAFAARDAAWNEIQKKKDEIEKLQAALDKKKAELTTW